jgi:hypothetical protein
VTPDYLDGFETPAVRAPEHDKQHKPDHTADEPQPACGAQPADGQRWTVEEHDQNREHCRHQRCYGSPAPSKGGKRHVREAAADDHQLAIGGGRWSE